MAHRSTRIWLARCALVGNIARGLVYVVLGGAAARASLMARDASHDMRDTFLIIYRAPFGQVLLWLTAAGLAAYALWRLLDAILDARDRGTDLKGLAQRAAGLWISGLYVGLAFVAGKLAMGWGSSGGGNQGASKGAQLLLNQPFGQWLVGAVGLFIIGVGAFKVRKAFYDDFNELDSGWIRGMARYGHASRGVVFLVIGGFMVLAGVYRRSGTARGLSGVLQFVSEQQAGNAIVLALGAGLAFYGITQALTAYFVHGARAGRSA